jgi:hypothetical protein
MRRRCHNWVSGGLEASDNQRIDGHILDWTANAVDEDDALERFIETIPGFYKSDMVKDIPESVEWSINVSTNEIHVPHLEIEFSFRIGQNSSTRTLLRRCQ